MGKWIASAILVLAFGIQGQAQGMKGGGPCAQDRETLCKGKMGKDMWTCMKDNKDKLSAECKAFHEQMKGDMKEVREVCHEDFQKFCADVKPGKGAIMECMHKHKDELSSACQSEINKTKADVKAKKGA